MHLMDLSLSLGMTVLRQRLRAAPLQLRERYGAYDVVRVAASPALQRRRAPSSHRATLSLGRRSRGCDAGLPSSPGSSEETSACCGRRKIGLPVSDRHASQPPSRSIASSPERANRSGPGPGREPRRRRRGSVCATSAIASGGSITRSCAERARERSEPAAKRPCGRWRWGAAPPARGAAEPMCG